MHTKSMQELKEGPHSWPYLLLFINNPQYQDKRFKLQGNHSLSAPQPQCREPFISTHGLGFVTSISQNLSPHVHRISLHRQIPDNLHTEKMLILISINKVSLNSFWIGYHKMTRLNTTLSQCYSPLIHTVCDHAFTGSITRHSQDLLQ